MRYYFINYFYALQCTTQRVSWHPAFWMATLTKSVILINVCESMLIMQTTIMRMQLEGNIVWRTCSQLYTSSLRSWRKLWSWFSHIALSRANLWMWVLYYGFRHVWGSRFYDVKLLIPHQIWDKFKLRDPVNCLVTGTTFHVLFWIFDG